MGKIEKKIKSGAKIFLNNILPENTPDFIIVGAQKAGTSSLYYYLKQHNKLIGSQPKEIHYFDYPDNYSKGKKWYHQFFRDYKKPLKKGLSFEASPSYLYRTGVAESIKKDYPNIKIIILLREPTKRAYSSWNMYRASPYELGKIPNLVLNYRQNGINTLFDELYQSKEFPSFEECVNIEMDRIITNSNIEEPSFVRRGIYYPQVKKYIELFGEKNVLILGFKDFIMNKKNVLNQILKFLNLPPSDWSFLNEEIKNSRSYPISINPKTEKLLHEFYKPHNELLFSLLGKEINW